MTSVALAGALLAGCALLAPLSREEFVLVRLNGNLIPANLWEGPGVDGTYAEHRFLWSKLTIFEGGRFAWDVKDVMLIDGVPEGEGESEARIVGPYEDQDSVLALSWMFRARIVGDTLYMRDVSGVSSHATFEFVRTP